MTVHSSRRAYATRDLISWSEETPNERACADTGAGVVLLDGASNLPAGEKHPTSKLTSLLRAASQGFHQGRRQLSTEALYRYLVATSHGLPLSVDVPGDYALYLLPGNPSRGGHGLRARGSAPITVIADAPSVPSRAKRRLWVPLPTPPPPPPSAPRELRAPSFYSCLHLAARPVGGVHIRPSTSKRKRKITRNRYAPHPPMTTFSAFAIVHRDRGLRAWNREEENTSASRFTRQLRWGVGTRGCERYLRDMRVRASREASTAQGFVKRGGIEESIIMANIHWVPPESEGDDPRCGRQAMRQVVLRVYVPSHRDQSTEWIAIPL
ncbi:hypothetical protein B0H14DRAFT_2639864 [Mycena olivaceomarginata]|nr:hypothetical protein B0H14DRAFT_2639864 [Mycena olivaceomarginata]